MADPNLNTDNSYLVFIVEPEWDPAETSETEWAATADAHRAFSQAVRDAGCQVLDGDALQPPAAAVRIQPATDGHPAIFTDGPFGETKELVTGYYKITARDLAQARELAALCPTGGHIEVWPILDVMSQA